MTGLSHRRSGSNKVWVVAVAAAFAVPALASGQVFEWTGASGGAGWSNPANWNPGLPTSGPTTTLTFNNAAVPTMTMDIAGGLSLNRLEFGAASVVRTLSGTQPLIFTGTTPSIDYRHAAGAAGQISVGVLTTLLFELGGAGRGIGYDALNVGGQLLRSGIVEVELLGSFMPTAGSSFDLIDFSSVSGTFSQLRLPELPLGLEWDTSAFLVHRRDLGHPRTGLGPRAARSAHAPAASAAVTRLRSASVGRAGGGDLGRGSAFQGRQGRYVG